MKDNRPKIILIVSFLAMVLLSISVASDVIEQQLDWNHIILFFISLLVLYRTADRYRLSRKP